jgi:hypothetical protein
MKRSRAITADSSEGGTPKIMLLVDTLKRRCLRLEMT